jgi:predicted metal-dependent enzyme (double-stranded beta helix superfamily)
MEVSTATVDASFAGLVRALIDLGDPGAHADQVSARLAAFRPSDLELIRLVYLRPERYTRTLLYRDGRFELILVCWSPGARSPIHDHGEQDCWLLPLAGSLSLEDFALVGGELHCVRRRDRVRTLDHRDLSHQIHRVSAAAPALSLHLYARPIDRCRIYDDAGRSQMIRLGYDRIRRLGTARGD